MKKYIALAEWEKSEKIVWMGTELAKAYDGMGIVPLSLIKEDIDTLEYFKNVATILRLDSLKEIKESINTIASIAFLDILDVLD